MAVTGAVDILIALAALALCAVLAFRLGVWWTNWRSRRGWKRRYLDGLIPADAKPSLPNCSSPVADGVPGDNPAGVSISPTNVPPAGARVDISNVHRGIESGHDAGLSAASEFFPQHRGR